MLFSMVSLPFSKGYYPPFAPNPFPAPIPFPCLSPKESRWYKVLTAHGFRRSLNSPTGRSFCEAWTTMILGNWDRYYFLSGFTLALRVVTARDILGW